MNEIQKLIKWRKLFNPIVDIVFNRQLKAKLIWAGIILILLHAVFGLYGHFPEELAQLSKAEIIVGGTNYFFQLLFTPIILNVLFFVMIKLLIFPLLFEAENGKKRKKNVNKFIKHNLMTIRLVSTFLIFSISFGELDFQIKAAALIVIGCLISFGIMLRRQEKIFAKQLFLTNLFLIIALQNEVISNMIQNRTL